MGEKLKSWIGNDRLFWALLVVLVGVVSFGLGRLSVGKERADAPALTAGVQFIDVLPESSTVPAAPEEAILLVGSRTGSKYHLPECPGAQAMKEENKIYFESVALARAAGYEPAANCKGVPQ